MIHHISVLVVMDEDQGLDEGKQTKTKESFSREGGPARVNSDKRHGPKSSDSAQTK